MGRRIEAFDFPDEPVAGLRSVSDGRQGEG
jgi:hypothetical protein